MFGATRRHVCMMCQLKPPRPNTPGHTATISVREDALVDGLRQFLADHLLGPTRAVRLAATMHREGGAADADRGRRLDEVSRRIRDINARRARLIASLEACADPDPDLIHGIQVRMAELRAERDQAESIHRELVSRVREDVNPDLLDILPTGALPLDLPDPVLRRLFDLLQLQIAYDRSTRHATYRCTLTALTIAATVDLLRRHISTTGHRQRATPPNRTLSGNLVVSGRYILDTTTATDLDDTASAPQRAVVR